MNWYKDSLLCLNEAEEIIQQIEELEKNSIHDIELLERCKPKIKNCLENCRSPLDFVSNYLFDTYCKEKYTLKELKNKRNNYPISYKENSFHNYLNREFRNLTTIRYDIVKEIKNTQPFKNNNQWLSHLTSLVNENKHARLTSNKSEKYIHTGNMKFGGINFSNNTLINVGVPLSINGIEYDLINTFPPGSNPNEVTSKYTTYFEELNMSVIETLRDIHRGVSEIIKAIEIKEQN